MRHTAKMSGAAVIGVDFGGECCVVAQAKRGGVDVVLNEASNRRSPSLIVFDAKERVIGEQAAALKRSRLKNAVWSPKHLLGPGSL